MASTPRQHLRLMLLLAFARFTRWSNAGLPKPGSAAGQPPANPRILVIRPDHIGDLLFATPALHALRPSFPDASITVIALNPLF